MADLYVQPILGQPSQNKIGQRTLYFPAAPDKMVTGKFNYFQSCPDRGTECSRVDFERL